MTVDKPTPGNLIATVSELVDSANSGSVPNISRLSVYNNLADSGNSDPVIMESEDYPTIGLGLSHDVNGVVTVEKDGMVSANGYVDFATSDVDTDYRTAYLQVVNDFFEGGRLIVSPVIGGETQIPVVLASRWCPAGTVITLYAGGSSGTYFGGLEVFWFPASSV